MQDKWDFVIVGLQPWYTSIGSNCKNIALELSRNHRVLYINAPLDRRTLLKKNSDSNVAHHWSIIRDKKNPFEQVSPGFHVYYPQQILESINWIPFTPVFEIFNRLNSRRFARDIRKATATLGFKDYVIFNDNDIFKTIHFKKLLKPFLYIYYCRDYLRSTHYWKKHGNTMEPKHIRLADIALANSGYLHNYLLQFNPSSFYVGQGCDTVLFDGKTNREEPVELKHIPHPRIGYVGVLTNMRLDIDCLVNIAKSEPAWQVVLVGPEDAAFRDSELHQLPNVHFVGKKTMAELPAFIAHFDVCLNPQLLNDMTIGNYPLKIDEYLNMGKPVVATRTITMEAFSEYVYLAEKASDYPVLIHQALAGNSPEKTKARMEFAGEHTWANSVRRIYNAIKTVTRLSGR